MIGVVCAPEQRESAEELFQLFKVQWEWVEPGRGYQVIVLTGNELEPEKLDGSLVLHFAGGGDPETPVPISFGTTQLPIYTGVGRVDVDGEHVAVTDAGAPAAVRRRSATATVITLGYDLLNEVAFLLGTGQPPELAAYPTLDRHLELLRGWIVDAGLPVVEVAPAPWGHPFTVCLTHDIDFYGIRRHRLDHSVLGFAYRASVGSLVGIWRGRRTWRQLFRNLSALARLPFVHLGLAKDFWQPFDDYGRAERGLPSTYFVIPFKDRPGEHVVAQRPALRATRYDVTDVAQFLPALERSGCEVAVHGIDAWHDADAARRELDAVAAELGHDPQGIRMHWLCYSRETPRLLERAGFAWDATFGYNDAVGYRAGTTQPFGHTGRDGLLQIPLHLQDTALFLPRRGDLSEREAWVLCTALREHTRSHGGALVITWHDRSLAPERLWDRFYARLLEALRSDDAWFATLSELVAWTRSRREARIAQVEVGPERVRLRMEGDVPDGRPALTIRMTVRGADGAVTSTEARWGGEPILEIALP